MSYQNIMSAPLFDFGDIKKSEATIKNTWNEFRIALANKAFKYDEVDSALTTTFLKVFDDLFSNCCAQLECSLNSFQANGYLARGTKLKALETVSYDRFLPKAEFINEDKDKFFQLKAEVKDQDGYTVSSSHVFSIMERDEYKKITSESAGLKQMLLLFLSSFYFAGL